MGEIKNHGKKWFYWFLLGIALIAVYKLLDVFPDVVNGIKNFLSVISPFFVGILIAYLIYIPCSKIENHFKKSNNKLIAKKSRTLSILISYVALIAIVVVVLLFIVPVLVESTVDFVSNIQGYVKQAQNMYNSLDSTSILKSQYVSDAINTVTSIDIRQYINLEDLGTYAKGAMGVVSGVVNTFVAFIVSVYILSERDKIYEFCKKFAKAVCSIKAYGFLSKYVKSANKIFLGFISSQLLDAIIVGILTTIAMSIMGVRYAPLLGFMIGLFNMIPYVGAIVAVIISAIITLITGGVSQAVWMIIIVTILQQIDANIINPKIVGKSLQVSPLLVILSVTIGGAYFGMIGIFLAVPISVLLKIIVEDYIDFKLLVKKEKKEDVTKI